MKSHKEIIVTDVDFLHKKSQEVDISDTEKMVVLKAYLMHAYKRLDGALQGLSAIQVGEPYAAILLRYVKGGKAKVVYNPKVLRKIGFRLSNEGCMSEPGNRYNVWRPLLAKVEYVTYEGEKIIEWLPYKKARIFCHEVDHCNGILLQDKGKVDKAWLLQSSLLKHNSSQVNR